MRLLFALFLTSAVCNAFTVPITSHQGFLSAPRAFVTKIAQIDINTNFQLYSTSEDETETASEGEEITKEQAVGNLVADDEWMGLSMEITELVRTAVIEDVKAKTSDFIGKDEYKVGDITKEIDDRVKTEIAKMRGKDEYELGDLSLALDNISKDITCELTGKEDYEFGDLSKEIDSRLKDKFSEICGKDEYEFGDLTKEMDNRAQKVVAEFTGKEDYEFGDISMALEERRKQWVEDTLGKEAADNYEFGDLTKNAMKNFTGKDEYEFGDVTKKLMGDLFGKRKKGGK